MGKSRKYDNVAPTLPTIMKYMDLCDNWRKTSWLAQEVGLTQDAVTKMCKRLTRAGMLESTKRGLGEENEFRASEFGRDIYEHYVDGCREVGIPGSELGAHLRSCQAMVEDVREESALG